MSKDDGELHASVAHEDANDAAEGTDLALEADPRGDDGDQAPHASSTEPDDDALLAAELAALDLAGSTEPGPSLRRLGWLYLVAGTLGLLGSAVLTLERIAKLLDTDHVASCSINAAIDCAPAMASWQGSLLGFPNPLLGLGAFPVVMMFGAVLLAGLRPPRWMWVALAVGATAGMALVVFLVYTSLAVLVVLCPWCFLVWLVTWPVFWYTLVHLVDDGVLPLGARARAAVLRNRFVVTVAWYLVVGALVVVALRHLF